MAAVTLLGSAVSTLNAARTVIVTPTVGDLIVIAVFSTGLSGSYAPTDDQAGAYTLVESALRTATDDVVEVYVAGALISSAVSTTFTYDTSPDANTGGGMLVFAVSGMSLAGLSAIRQSARQSNIESGTPTPALASAALTTNPMLGLVLNATNPAALTPRTSWTEVYDGGFSSPTTGLEAMTINSGETASSIAWGGSSATKFASIAVEFDSSTSGVTGTLDVTLGALTLSSTSSLSINGSLTATLDALTLSSTGTVALNASVNVTLGALTLSATGQQGTTGAGDLTVTLGALTLSATGSLSINASANITLADLTTTIVADLGPRPGSWTQNPDPPPGWSPVTGYSDFDPNDFGEGFTTAQWTQATSPTPSWS